MLDVSPAPRLRLVGQRFDHCALLVAKRLSELRDLFQDRDAVGEILEPFRTTLGAIRACAKLFVQKILATNDAQQNPIEVELDSAHDCRTQRWILSELDGDTVGPDPVVRVDESAGSSEASCFKGTDGKLIERCNRNVYVKRGPGFGLMHLERHATNDRVRRLGVSQCACEGDDGWPLARFHLASKRVPELIELKPYVQTMHSDEILPR
jgi:hypothetical protein